MTPGCRIRSESLAAQPLFLNPDGSVKAETRFFSFDAFDDFQRFGYSLAHLEAGGS